MAGKGLVNVAANLDIVCRTYARYGPGPVKSFLTMSANSFRVYWHISHSIWFIYLS